MVRFVCFLIFIPHAQSKMRYNMFFLLRRLAILIFNAALRKSGDVLRQSQSRKFLSVFFLNCAFVRFCLMQWCETIGCQKKRALLHKVLSYSCCAISRSKLLRGPARTFLLVEGDETKTASGLRNRNR